MKTFAFAPTPEESEFWRLFDLVRTDVVAAIQSFEMHLSVVAVKAEEIGLQEKINLFPTFWGMTLFALQTTFFISFGRIFDTSRGSLSVERLLRFAQDHTPIFSRTSLLSRKRFEERIEGENPEWLVMYVQNAWEPGRTDIEALLRQLLPFRRTFEAVYGPLRDKIYAHRDRDQAVYQLFARTEIEEVRGILRFVYTTVCALQQIALNGRRPELQDSTEYESLVANAKSETETFLRRLV